ncbi:MULTISPECIES: glycosyltransferase family 2 protein [Paenibacillus]|uniref:glycosyltransferase family 2 protein n=1 Tax=Paenibacillus TaxID=44249 RepID=UPI0022B9081A|nr:glycosyltransferase family 2 protein [Paenibacillus caseinilyticus]MCZ8523110.1 glycosyltransferase [Paenibacillus caseinilyticus]
MKISLVLATLGSRHDEIIRLLESLDNQSYKNFELIVVDQNEDDALRNLLLLYNDKFKWQYVKSEKGLSLSRNNGLKYVSGDIICFPDDDCWFNEQVLQRVVNTFQNNSSFDGLTGGCFEPDGSGNIAKFDSENGYVDFYSVWTKAVSCTIFLKKNVLDTVGGFDTNLGVGAKTPFKSGEETDLMIRVIKSEFTVFYDSELIVYHPNPIIEYDARTYGRAYTYGCGFGQVLKKHSYPLMFVLKCLIRPMGGSILNLITFNTSKAKYHLNVFKGRVYGYTH